MFIVDEIEWKTPNPPPTKHDLIGGAGTYAVLGARLAVSPFVSLARSISWIVDIGADFPTSIKDTIDSWNTNCVFRRDMSRLTTRAWNGYGANEWRDFKYTTPKIRLEVSSLNPAQTMSDSFHMVCSSQRCIDITTKLNEARASISERCRDPVVVWEPIPDLCSPEELTSLQLAAKNCSVISPNHDELKLFFPAEGNVSQVELVSKFMGWDPSETAEQNESNTIPIIREGGNGSTAYFRIKPALTSSVGTSNQLSPRHRIVSVHLMAYHTQSTAGLVVDPTGGGNTYLGALAVSMTNVHFNVCHPSLKLICSSLGWQLMSEDLYSKPVQDMSFNARDMVRIQRIVVAMIYANIAASFAIEQNGVPVLATAEEEERYNHKNSVQTSSETWNGETFLERLQAYLDRETPVIQEQMDRIRNLR